MATKTIRGKLVPANSEASACAFVRVRLYWSFTENGLKEIVTKDSKWDENGISFHSVTDATGEEDIIKFVAALENIMKTEDAVRLGLTGYFTVVIEKDGLSQTFKVTITDGNVSCEEDSPLKTDVEVFV